MDVGIGYLWVLAIALMTIHPRFYVFRLRRRAVVRQPLAVWLAGAQRSAIMGLVAILHLVEALLILVHGHRDATPVYVRRQDGRVVGGFALQKFWPMPFIALIAFRLSGKNRWAT